MSAVGYEPSLEPGKAANLHETASDPRVLDQKEIVGIAQRNSPRLLLRRPNWLSPEMWALVVCGIDFCLIPAGAVPAFEIYSGINEQMIAEPGRHGLTSVLAATIFVALLERFGGYQLKQLLNLRCQLGRSLTAWGLTVAVLLVVGFFTKTSDIYSRDWMLSWIITVPILVLIARGILRALIATAGQAGSTFARSVAIIGAGVEGQRLVAKIRTAQDKSVTIRGVFDDRKTRIHNPVSGLAVCGTTDDLLELARLAPVDEIIIALPLEAEFRILSLCDKLKALAIDVRLSLEPLTEGFRGRRIGSIVDLPVLYLVNRPLKNWRGFVKILEDKLLGTCMLIMLGPIIVLISIFIKLNSPGPILFVQQRFGFNNEVIRVFKFRTMYADRSDSSGAERTIRDDPRVTRIGRVLRRLSLDELPQLINVVRGDMSLVGPRPHAVAMMTGDRLYCEAVAQYTHRHRVKPGLTGWAQVNGLRGEVDTLEKARARVAHDLHYIEHWSPSLDLKILVKTVRTLVSCKNAY
jgi:Undecaprenyl-phosphate glucose phosphotransferase